MTTIKAPENAKNAIKYNCEFCDFNTCKKSNYDKHLLTPKHEKNSKILQILQNTTYLAPENAENKNYNCNCGKSYKHHSSLWNHKKNCFQTTDNKIFTEKKEPEKKPDVELQIDHEINNNNELEIDMKNTIVELLKQNQEFQKQIIELMKDNMGNTTNNNIINNTTNNKFNLNVFLNETCKDALNLSDFLESLILTLTDFENFGPLGYCGGISNILVKGLNKLDISKRPIHCSDLKREVIHIKNNDAWHKDEDNQQMIKAIKAIEHKNIKQMNLWAKANPEYKDPNHKKSDLYTKLIDQSLCDTDKEKAMKNYNKIIRTVAKEVLVDKS
uniref:C2H2-type domain-containing protein n=1 Tax=viral metagenome TaxID=1070528 RepID=A0A6C0HB21_9ZZZZ